MGKGRWKMLGLIYTLIISIGLIIHWGREKKENTKCKTLYKHKDGLTYTDLKGCSRLIDDDTLVFYTHNNNGDYILEDISGYVYKNFSEEQKKINENKLKALTSKTGNTFCIDNNQYKNDWVCQGRRFIDKKTKDIYVVRYINGKYYYMNTLNGMIERETDWQIKKNKETTNNNFNNGIDIKVFNENQKNIKDEKLLFRNFDYNSLCDYRD